MRSLGFAARTVMPSFKLGQIVGMHRLPQFRHHIIGDIDDG